MRIFSAVMWRWVFTGILCLVAVSCTNEVRFVDMKADGKTNVGFLYYPPTPYMLVQTDAKGVRSATLISLPDVTKPHRVVHRGGWGTVDFNFKVSNGMITEFGEKFDSKGPETISAVSGGMTSLLGAVAPFLGAAPPSVAGEAVFTVTPVATAHDKLQDVAGELQHADLQVARGRIVTIQTTLNNLKTLKIKQSGSGDLFRQIVDHQAKVTAELTKLRGEMAGLEGMGKAQTVDSVVAGQIASALIPLRKAVGLLTSYVRAKSSGIELYEVKDINGTVKFVPVPFPTPASP